MSTSRRKFIKAGTMLGLSTVISLKSAHTVLGQQKSGGEQTMGAPLPQEIEVDKVAALSEASFSAHLNTDFRIHIGLLKVVDLKLVEVKHSEQPSKSSLPAMTKQEGFSILFVAPRGLVLQQGTYKVEHEQMGTFDLFIVPMRKNKKGQYYEAIFNRLMPKDDVK
jgi:Domain of unknown function (DUF6916)